MSAELISHNVIYDQTTDRSKIASEPIWLNAGPDRVLIISVYDAAQVLAKEVPAEDITTEPSAGITLTLRRFNTNKTPEVPEQPTLRIDTVMETMRRSGSERMKPRRSTTSDKSRVSNTRPRTNRQ